MKIFILVISMILTQTAFATTTSNDFDQKLQKAAADYQIELQKKSVGEEILFSFLQHDPVDDCEPTPPPTKSSCIDAICNKMDSWDCDDKSEIDEVARACRGVYDGQCITNVCGRMDSWDCDDLSELKEVAAICKQSSSDCIPTACKRLDSWDCDDISELKQMGQACKGLYDVSCIDSVCDRMDPWDCDDTSEIIGVINSCKGQ